MQAAQQRIVRSGGWAQGPSSLMAVLDLTRNEVMNCRVVRWLLDPLARHEIGARFIAELADRLAIDLPDPAAARAAAEVIT